MNGNSKAPASWRTPKLLLLVVLLGCSRSTPSPAPPSFPSATAPATERLAAIERTLNYSEAVTFLKTCLAAPEVEVRLAALDRLASFHDVAHLRTILDRYEDADPRVRLAALEAGRELGARGSLPWWEKARRDPEAAIRKEALLAVVVMGEAEAGTNGTWRGFFRGQPGTGSVQVAVNNPVPATKLVAPLRYQEHPRLGARRADWQAPTNWTFNAQADAALENAMQPRQQALNVEWAVAAIEMARAYDAMYWRASPAMRRYATEAMLGMARGLLFSSGGQSTPWHNWQGRWRGGAGIAAIVALNDPRRTR
jgi:hypothetical protein